MSEHEHLSRVLSDELLELLDRVCEGKATSEDSERLSELLLGRRTLQLAALRYLDLHSTLQWRWRGGRAMSSADSTSAIICFAMSDIDNNLDRADDVEPLPALRPPLPEEPTRLALLTTAAAQKTQRAWGRIRRNLFERSRRGWAEGMVALAAAILIAVLLLQPLPPEPPIATVVETANVTWAQDQLSPVDDALAVGPYGLEAGVVKIRTARGVEVNLEAPSRFELISVDRLRLVSGVLYAEARGTDPESGPEPELTVLTPTAVVQDLGTAFGVAVAPDGSTDTVVMEGVVTMSTPGAPEQERVFIPEAFSSRVSIETGVVEPVQEITSPHVYERFPRRVTQRMWLANLICEPESGVISDCYCGLSFVSGKRLSWEERQTSQRHSDWEYNVKNKYLVTPALDAIDGVFIPFQGAVVDGAGQTYDGFKESSGLWTYGDLWVGRPFVLRDVVAAQHRRRLDAAAIGRQAIAMHGPKGFTVDLHQVSDRRNGFLPSRFRAALFNFGGHDSRLDFWVLVDGNPVYVQRDLQTKDGIQTINVTLPPDARYLTLATMMSTSYSWVVIDQAIIELDDDAAVHERE